MADNTTYELIHARVTDPANALFKMHRNDKASSMAITCSNKDKCGLYARGECAKLAIMNSTYCPYGKTEMREGFTKKARGYHTWLGEKRELYKAVINKLGAYKNKIAIIGDYVFLPYSHMNMNESVAFTSKGGAFMSGQHFVPIQEFTVETIRSIIQFRPHALMGGEIESYQKEVVPKFLTHLKVALPGLFADAVKDMPHVANIATSVNPIGRKALLHTLKPGTVVTKYHGNSGLKTQHWTWDGAYLNSTDAGVSFPVVEYDECSIKMKPKPNACVEITSEAQVDDDTEFAD